MKKPRFSFRALSLMASFVFTASLSHNALGQGFAIGGVGGADPSAILDVRADEQGVLIPRVALISTTNPIAQPATSLLVWNTSQSGNYPTPGFYFWNGSDWTKLLLEGGDIAVNSLRVDGNLVEVSAEQLNSLLSIEGNIEDRLASLEATDGVVTVDLTALQSQITANDGEITTLQATDVTLQTQITANDGDITTLQSDVATAQTAADAAQSDVDGFNDALKNLSAAEVGQLENIDATTVSASQWGYLGSTDQALATTDSVRFAEIASAGSIALEGATDDDFEASLVVTDPTADRTITFQDADGTVALLSDITTLDSDLQNQITANDGEISALQAADVSLQNQITANDGEITTLQAADVTLQNQITANDGDITTLQAADVTLQGEVATAQAAANAAQSDVDGFQDSLKNLSATEVGQLENLDSTTVSATQWGYLGSTDQAVATTDSVRFAEIASAGSIALEGITDDDFEASLVVTDPTADRTITFQDADGTVALLSDITTLDSDLQNQITANDGEISALQAADVTLESQITANDGDITTLQVADATLQNQITANDGEITTLQAADVTLQGEVATAQAAADAAQSDVDGFDDSLKNLSATEVGQLENLDSTTVSTTQWGYLGSTDQAVATTNSVRFAEIESAGSIALEGVTDDDFEASLVVTDPTADRTITFQDADGTVALLSDITTLDSDLQNQITANDGEISTLQAADVTLQNQIAANDGDITTLQVADTTLQNQITANDGDITTLQTADVTLQGEVATAQTAADAAQSDVDGFDDSLKNLSATEVGQLGNLDSTTVSATQWDYLGSTDQALATTDSVRFAEIASAGSITLEGATDDDFEASLVVADPTADRTITFQDADGTVALLSDITTLDSDLQNQITANDGEISTLQAADVTLQNQITANDGDITTLQAADTTLQTQITANDGDLAALNARTLSAGTGLTGGGDLSANRTIAIANGGVGTTQLADNAVTDTKVVDELTVNGGTIDNSPIGATTPSSIAATTLVASTSVQLPDEGASPSPSVGMIRYNSAGYLEFYHEVSTGVFAWVPVNSYAP